MNTIRDLRERAGLTQEELASKIGVHVQSVWSWENGKSNPKGKRLKALCDFFNVSAQEIENPKIKTRIPVVGYVPAGIPFEAIEDIVDYEDIPQEWPGDYFGLKVRGDSMAPKYLNGDTVIVKVQPVCDSGQDCIVQVNGFDATLKTVVIRDGYFELVPYNSEYDTLRFKDIKILGVVVELRRKI